MPHRKLSVLLPLGREMNGCQKELLSIQRWRCTRETDTRGKKDAHKGRGGEKLINVKKGVETEFTSRGAR